MRQKPSAKPKGLNLHNRRQGEGMQSPETTAFVE
jgi:hypothetical protein